MLNTDNIPYCENNLFGKAVAAKNHTFHIEEYLPCAKFQFFPWCGFSDTEVQSFSILPTWLSHHVTYDIIFMTKSFYMFYSVSIRQVVVEKNMKVLCGQTNNQTDRQTDRQTSGPKRSTLSFGEGKNVKICHDSNPV